VQLPSEIRRDPVPVCATTAIPHVTSIQETVFRGFSYTMTYNVTGWAAAVVRYGESATSRPINLQIAAHPWREDIAPAIARRPEISRTTFLREPVL